MTTWLRANWKIVLVVLTTALVAAALGRLVKPKVVTVVKTVQVDHDVVHTVTVEKPVIKYLTRTVVKTVYVPGTAVVASTTVTTTSAGSTSQGSTTTTNEAKTETSSASTSTSPVAEGRWSARALVGLSTSSGTVVGAAAEYRLIGPLTVGAWATTTLGAPSLQAGASVGLRL